MNRPLPVVYLVGHGETAWSLTGQHLGARDLPLIERGERNALRLKERLRGLEFAKVFTGPQQRMAKTCELAGYGDVSEVDGDLVDWNHGVYEGRADAEILRERPGWNLFRDGCPGGETPRELAARAARVVERLQGIGGNVLAFSGLHFIQALAVCWIGLDDLALAGRLTVSAASVSGLGYEGSDSCPVIRFWNDVHHTGG